MWGKNRWGDGGGVSIEKFQLGRLGDWRIWGKLVGESRFNDRPWRGKYLLNFGWLAPFQWPMRIVTRNEQ